MNHQVHETHSHMHGENCGHLRIKHENHFDFLHNGHLHTQHKEHFDECSISVSQENPVKCAEIECGCQHNDCQHETIPHGDHFDYLVSGRLHFKHDEHCDDHGSIMVV